MSANPHPYKAPEAETTTQHADLTLFRGRIRMIVIVASAIVVAICLVNLLSAFRPVFISDLPKGGVYPWNYRDLVVRRAFNELLETAWLLVPATIGLLWASIPRGYSSSIAKQQ